MRTHGLFGGQGIAVKRTEFGVGGVDVEDQLKLS